MRGTEIDLHAHPEMLAEVEACCIVLFERWCENRRVLPLAFLMHAWPMARPTVPLVRRLSISLHDLLVTHTDSLDRSDRKLINHALNAIDRVLGGAGANGARESVTVPD
jgi:hypothetical protein